MKTILKYPGSKGSMRDTIIKMMPAHKLYGEPYDQHEDLLCVLQNLKAKVILRRHRCELYDDLLTKDNSWHRTDIDHITQAHSTKTECLWTNYFLPESA